MKVSPRRRFCHAEEEEEEAFIVRCSWTSCSGHAGYVERLSNLVTEGGP